MDKDLGRGRSQLMQDLGVVVSSFDFIPSTAGGVLAGEGQNLVCAFKRWYWYWARVGDELAGFRSSPGLRFSLGWQWLRLQSRTGS